MDGIDEKTVCRLIVQKLMLLERSVPIGVSNHHVHLCRDDLEMLFGKGYELTVKKELTQPGEFASNETVTVIGPSGILDHVRVLGPVRGQTQIELLRSDLYTLGIKADVRLSGDLANTPAAILRYRDRFVRAGQGVIVAQRHIHVDTERAESLGLRNGECVDVEVRGDRALVFKSVAIRVKKGAFFEMHIDQDEANACGIGSSDAGYLTGENCTPAVGNKNREVYNKST